MQTLFNFLPRNTQSEVLRSCYQFDFVLPEFSTMQHSLDRAGITKSEVGGQSRHNLWHGIIR